MDNGIPDGAANHEAGGLGEAATPRVGVGMLVDDRGHALLDLFWPMPIGLLVMGTAVAVFFGICSMLR